jgi:hypothetical protein
MSRALVIIGGRADREKAARWCMGAPVNTRVEFKAARRSTDQNAKMWAMLSEIASQVTWHGLKLSAEDWKDLLTASFRKEVRTVPNLDGNGFVVLGMRTSDMSRQEMADLIELMHAFGARQGVTFSEPAEVAA